MSSSVMVEGRLETIRFTSTAMAMTTAAATAE